MKLVSPKTLLACLLGIVFIIMKVMTFDGLQDLFWIVFSGYLTIKGLIVAFSREAYDEDVKKAYQGKALYRDLFGRFAYIATDIPLIIILLAGLLAAFCPATTLLKVILGALLIFAVGYAPWLSWYISKHERLRMESGEWGTATLSSEDEKSWKRSNTGTILASVHLRYCVPCIYFLEIPESISITISWKTLSRSLPPTS